MIVRVILVAAVSYVIYVLALFLLQRQIIYPGQHFEPPVRSRPPADGVVHWLTTSSGRVEAWYLPPTPPSQEASTASAIFFHGNGELIDHWPDAFDPARAMGLGVMLVEYPGYGRSEGKPSERSITEAALAAYDELVSMPGIDPDRIVAYGRSLGGGPATALARERAVAALVLLSTFTSARSFAKGFLAPSFLVRDRFDNLGAVSQYDGPVLVMHGRHDDQIPYRHATILSEAARTGSLVSYDCSHNDCPPAWAPFWMAVQAFLVEHDILPAP